MIPSSRREFLVDVGRGMLVAGLGTTVAGNLGFSTAFAERGTDALKLGSYESLVELIRTTPPDKLQPILITMLKAGEVDNKKLISAAALANAEAFGGQDYVGYHTAMAMLPALEMAKQLPSERQALPVLKVIYRNSQQCQQHGGASKATLMALHAAEHSPEGDMGLKLRDACRKADMDSRTACSTAHIRWQTRSRGSTVIEAARTMREDLPLIVTGHLHMSGGAVSELSERRIVIGGEEAVSSDIFPASVAYVALGHLHKPQSISGQTVIRYAGSPFPMSVAEKDYQHSIVVIDLAGTAGIKTNLVRTPRPVAFLRVPTVGAAPLSSVEDELRRIEIDDPGEHRRPFLEIAVRLDGPEPELRQRIEVALEGKPVRLTRIVRQTEGQGDALADTVEGDTELDELEPAPRFCSSTYRGIRS